MIPLGPNLDSSPMQPPDMMASMGEQATPANKKLLLEKAMMAENALRELATFDPSIAQLVVPFVTALRRAVLMSIPGQDQMQSQTPTGGISSPVPIGIGAANA